MSSGASNNNHIGINKIISGGRSQISSISRHQSDMNTLESQNPSLVHSSPATTLSDDVDNSGPGGPEFISTRVIDRDASAPQPKAEDTLGGVTSADVHGGIGKPIQGQSSAEVRHS